MHLTFNLLSVRKCFGGNHLVGLSSNLHPTYAVDQSIICVNVVTQFRALNYSADWCSIEGEEQRPKIEPWGMTHEVGSGKCGRKTIHYLYFLKVYRLGMMKTR